jgi:hypothetical protein
MKEQSEFSEFIVVGIFSLLFISSVYLTIFNISGQVVLSSIKEITSSYVVLLVILSYTIGILTSRTLLMLDYEFFKKLTGNFFLRRIFSQSDVQYIENFDRSDWIRREILVQQYGSEGVVGRIRYQHSLMRIFKASTILLPISSLFYAIWIFKNYGIGNSIFFTSTILIGAYLSFKSHRSVKNSEVRLISGASQLIEEQLKTNKQ